MINIGPTYIWTAVNLIFLYLVLRHFLFKPVTEFMENREKLIVNSLEEANRNKSEAETLKNRYDAILKNAKSEAEEIVNEAVKKGNKEYEKILNNSKLDSEAMLLKAREQIKIERKEMIKDVKNQVASLALAAASKVISENMDTDKNRSLINKFLEEGVA